MPAGSTDTCTAPPECACTCKRFHTSEIKDQRPTLLERSKIDPLQSRSPNVLLHRRLLLRAVLAVRTLERLLHHRLHITISNSHSPAKIQIQILARKPAGRPRRAGRTPPWRRRSRAVRSRKRLGGRGPERAESCEAVGPFCLELCFLAG